MMPPPVFREKRKTGKTRTGWHERKALFVGKYRKQRILAYMLCVKTRKQGKQRLVLIFYIYLIFKILITQRGFNVKSIQTGSFTAH